MNKITLILFFLISPSLLWSQNVIADSTLNIADSIKQYNDGEVQSLKASNMLKLALDNDERDMAIRIFKYYDQEKIKGERTLSEDDEVLPAYIRRDYHKVFAYYSNERDTVEINHYYIFPDYTRKSIFNFINRHLELIISEIDSSNLERFDKEYLKLFLEFYSCYFLREEAKTEAKLKTSLHAKAYQAQFPGKHERDLEIILLSTKVNRNWVLGLSAGFSQLIFSNLKSYFDSPMGYSLGVECSYKKLSFRIDHTYIEPKVKEGFFYEKEWKKNLPLDVHETCLSAGYSAIEIPLYNDRKPVFEIQPEITLSRMYFITDERVKDYTGENNKLEFFMLGFNIVGNMWRTIRSTDLVSAYLRFNVGMSWPVTTVAASQFRGAIFKIGMSLDLMAYVY